LGIYFKSINMGRTWWTWSYCGWWRRCYYNDSL